jgi:hypothetical protein
MAEREFPDYTVRSGASLEGSRYTAWLAVVPHGHGFPVYYTICENASRTWPNVPPAMRWPRCWRWRKTARRYSPRATPASPTRRLPIRPELPPTPAA